MNTITVDIRLRGSDALGAVPHDERSPQASTYSTARDLSPALVELCYDQSGVQSSVWCEVSRNSFVFSNAVEGDSAVKKSLKLTLSVS